MSEEDYYKVFSISVNGDYTPLLDSVADNPQIRELSLRDSAGVDTKIKTVRLHDRIFKLQFLDFSKQEQFKFLRRKFKPCAILIVYDATVMASFNKAETWLQEKAIPGNGSVRMLLVGNDHSLHNNDVNKVVNTALGQELARRFQISFIETSADNPANLEQALRNITELIESSKINETGAIQMEG